MRKYAAGNFEIKATAGWFKVLGFEAEHSVQASPYVLKQSLVIEKALFGKCPSVIVLGANKFHGRDIYHSLANVMARFEGARAFAYPVQYPEHYGVTELDAHGRGLSVDVKPQQPKSNYVVTGLYFYGIQVVELPKMINPSLHGELGIADFNRLHLGYEQLSVVVMGRGYVWLDSGTQEELLDASHFIAIRENHQALKVSLQIGERLTLRLDQCRTNPSLGGASDQERLWPVSVENPQGKRILMKAISLAIPNVVLIEPQVFGDERGFFFESFNQAQFEAAIGKPVRCVQDNHSRSIKNVLRGLNYLIQQPQGKIDRVVHGEVFEVAVDLRKSSETFGLWVGEILSAKNKRQLWVPEGFAHGVVVISDTAEFLYKTTDYYAPAHERCILWHDTTLQIEWPEGIHPILSMKDALGQSLTEAEVFA